jgi:hypothetical protein
MGSKKLKRRHDESESSKAQVSGADGSIVVRKRL